MRVPDHLDLVREYEAGRLDPCTLCKHRRCSPEGRFCGGCDFFDNFEPDPKRYAAALARLVKAKEVS